MRRRTELQILGEWIEPNARVLDLGCGRGLLLESLMRAKSVRGLGVDPDPEKVLACVRRGVPVYQGDAEAFLREVPEGSYDWVVCSRTVQELGRPGEVLKAAARAGRRVAVGFVNFGYWRNRLAVLGTGERIRNDVYPRPWEESAPQNPVTLDAFEAFCARAGLVIHRRLALRGDWVTPCLNLPSWRAGYALYELERRRA